MTSPSNPLTHWISESWRPAIGAFLAMGLSAVFLHSVRITDHWLLAPLAATLAILFVQPHSPVAQPWPVLGSYLFLSWSVSPARPGSRRLS